jgi:hypothetical protein
MTPKDKAKELISRFNFQHTGDSYTIFQNVDESKICCLIAIDEIQDFITKYNNPFEDFKYWDEVKNEIEKL